MCFWSMCDSDPLMEFIRSTYDAIPLKLPDPRVKVLSLFTVVEKRVRYLGDLADLMPSEGLTLPRIDENDIPDISKKSSRSLSWGVALDLLGPFLAKLLALTQVDVETSFKSAQKGSDGLRLTLARAKRSFIHPIACASIFEHNTARLPAGLDSELGIDKSKPLYLIDSILSAREITLMLEGSNATDDAVRIETGLAGKLSAENILRRKSELSITGTKRATFAFTCLKLIVDSSRVITGLEITSKLPRLGATGVTPVLPVVHTSIGAPNELITFDD